MKTFARSKTLDEIREAVAIAPGFSLDSRLHDESGHDHVLVTGRFGSIRDGKPARLLYNAFNGRFFGEVEGIGQISSDSTNYEDKPWFAAMLDFFYVPKAKGL